jgi:phosphatidylglycerol:prolipoprotein diacylglycerol transferase
MLAYYVHHFSPFLIQFHEQFGLRYYGLAYALGFVFLYFGLHYLSRKGWSQLPPRLIDDFVAWMCLAGVIGGGRLGYCLLYDFQHTLRNPLSIFQLWHGGMASHGGIAGAIAVLYFYGRRHQIPFYNLADSAALCTPLGLGLGRIANFINGELWGRPTTVSWAWIFPDATLVQGVNVPRHPSQLYEAALEGLLLFIILWTLRFRVKRDGVIALTFVGTYAVLRFIVEFFREPDAPIGYYFGWATQGQLLSLALLPLVAFLAWREFGCTKKCVTNE